MAPRPYWKGILRMSLVTIRVDVHVGVDTSSEISFRQLHKPSGRRINYEKTVQGVGKVESGDIVKGFEIGKDTYVVLEPDEIASIRLPSSRTIDILEFVARDAVDPRYFERPYILAPGDELSGEGYHVVRQALAEAGRVGITQIAMGGRESLAVVMPVGEGMVLNLVRYASELRPIESYLPADARKPVSRELVDLAKHLIATKSAAFEPAKYHDRYVDALRELIEKKRQGQTIAAPPEPEVPAGRVIDLMEALRKSVATAPSAAPASARPRRTGAKAAGGAGRKAARNR